MPRNRTPSERAVIREKVLNAMKEAGQPLAAFQIMDDADTELPIHDWDCGDHPQPITLSDGRKICGKCWCVRGEMAELVANTDREKSEG